MASIIETKESWNMSTVDWNQLVLKSGDFSFQLMLNFDDTHFSSTLLMIKSKEGFDSLDGCFNITFYDDFVVSSIETFKLNVPIVVNGIGNLDKLDTIHFKIDYKIPKQEIKHLQTYAADFVNYLTIARTRSKFFDITFEVKGEKIRAHKIVLAARSKYFSAMFTFNKNKTEIEIFDMEAPILNSVIDYIYTGKIPSNLENIAIQLFKAANLFHVESLEKTCIQFLLESIKVESVCNVYILARDFNIPDLKAEAMDFIYMNLFEVQNMPDWTSLGFAQE